MNELKKIAITTDTNSGMMPGETDAQGIFVLPMPFVIDGEVLLESVDLSRADFYQKLKAKTNITTSQPSVGEVTEFWRSILQEYDQIVHIPTSSGLSNAYSTALSLANDEEFAGRVFVVNNLRIAVCLKSSAFDAAKLRAQGKSAQEIREILEANAGEYSLYLSLETMEYLKRGGRISPAAAAIGSLLKLRPILRLIGGKLDKFAVPRTLQKAKDTLITAIKKDLTETYKEALEKGEIRLVVAHNENHDEAEAFESEMKKLFPDIPFLSCDELSLSIACHTGPGSLAFGIIRVINE